MSAPIQPGARTAQGKSEDPYKLYVILVSVLLIGSLPATMALTTLLQPRDEFQIAADRLGVPREDLVVGHDVFKTWCAACHGAEGEGIGRLGKPLRNSAFVQSQTPEQLLDLIRYGRDPTDPENTTGAAMPARAGNPGLDDERLKKTVSYLLMMQEPGAPTVSVEDWVRPEPEPGAVVLPGHDMFFAYCSSCHGENAEGMPDQGKPLRTSEFVASKTDEELLAFIKTGRPIWDPLNTTGIDMPPKGGNPALTDEQLMEIIGYIRAVQEAEAEASGS